VKNTWKPFQEKLLEEGRRLGICRKQPWIRSMGPLFVITILVAVLAAVVPTRIWHVGIGEANLIVLGLGTVSRRAARPKTATVDGQVIARWQERTDNENGSSTAQYPAIDDGQRAWTCSLSYVYQAFAVGDLVQVTFSPRTGDLKKVRLTARPRTEHSGGNPG
jgi:hypothetical protein